MRKVAKALTRLAIAASLAVGGILIPNVPAFAYDGGDPRLESLGAATQNVAIGFLTWPLASTAIGLTLVLVSALILVKPKKRVYARG